MSAVKRVEQFTQTELLGLQCDLQQMDIDAWEASGRFAAFLNGRGYGVDAKLLQDSIVRLEQSQCDMECMQTELERVALVM